MLVLVLIALGIIAVTILIHGIGTTSWMRYMYRHYPNLGAPMTPRIQFGIIIKTATMLICLHFIEILVWAGAYIVVAGEELGSFETAVYFSAVTFTTLGYGDITLSSEWRLLSGFAAINGIVLIGWTTAFLYAVMQKIWNPSRSVVEGENEDE